MSVEATSEGGRRGGLEVRSIDYVPLNERHGKLWHLGPLWFMSNAQIATLAVGVLGVTTGGNLIWSLIALVLGVGIGTFFMAAHSAQGPQLGLPQMIQSRPQFGYVGAILVWLFAYLQYAGFNIFNTLLAADAMDATVHGGTKLWIVVATVLSVAAALVGYDFIHRMEQGLTYGFLVLFGILTIVVLLLPYPAGSFDLGNFKLAPFLLQFSVVAGYQISWAIYVSDYSRYLPPDVTVRKTFWWTYGGSALGALWIMAIGSGLAAWAGANFDTIPSLLASGDRVFHRLRLDHPGVLRPRPDLGDGTEPVRRLADPDQRLGLVQARPADPHRPGRSRSRSPRPSRWCWHWPAPSRSWRTSRTSCCWCSTCSSRGPRSTWSTTS